MTEPQHPYTFNLKPKEDNPEDDPAFKAGEQMGEQMVKFTMGLIVLPFLIWAAWNVTMPAIFGLITINYFQSVGLYILSSILIK